MKHSAAGISFLGLPEHWVPTYGWPSCQCDGNYRKCNSCCNGVREELQNHKTKTLAAEDYIQSPVCRSNALLLELYPIHNQQVRD
jgi:hypothetical protein